MGCEQAFITNTIFKTPLFRNQIKKLISLRESKRRNQLQLDAHSIQVHDGKLYLYVLIRNLRNPSCPKEESEVWCQQQSLTELLLISYKQREKLRNLQNSMNSVAAVMNMPLRFKRKAKSFIEWHKSSLAYAFCCLFPPRVSCSSGFWLLKCSCPVKRIPWSSWFERIFAFSKRSTKRKIPCLFTVRDWKTKTKFKDVMLVFDLRFQGLN